MPLSAFAAHSCRSLRRAPELREIVGDPVVLYGSWGTPCVENLVRALLFKAVAFELCDAPGPEGERSEDEAMLEIEGQRIGETMAMLLGLEERFPEPPLLAKEPRLAAAQRQLAHWTVESHQWYLGRWQRLQPRATRSTPPPAPPRPAGVSLRDWLGRRARTVEPESRDRGPLVHEISHRMDDLSRLLGGRPYFYAQRLSMADLTVHTMLRTLADDRISGTVHLLEQHPGLRAFMERVEGATGGSPSVLARSVPRVG